MKTTSLLLGIFCNLFFTDSLSAALIYKPNTLKLNGYYISKNLYEDIRLLGDDGKSIRFWELRSKSLKITRFYDRDKLKILKLQNSKNGMINEVIYARVNDHFKLVFGKSRVARVLNNTVLFKNEKVVNEFCSSESDNLKKVKMFSEKFSDSILLESLETNIIDSSCKQVASEREYQKMLKALSSAMRPNNFLTTCLRDPKTAQEVASGMGKDRAPRIKNELDLLALKYELHMEKVSKGSESLKGFVSCEKASTNIPLAKYIENKGIRFISIGDENSDLIASSDKYLRAVYHENLHMLGIMDDDVTETLLATCYSDKDINWGNLAGRINGRPSSTTEMGISGTGTIFEDISTTQASVQNNTEGVPAKIPRELAENAIPNPSIEEVNQPFIEASEDLQKYLANPDVAANEALTKSAAANAPMLKFANGLMAAFVPSANAVPAGSGLRRPASLGSNGAKTESEDDYFVKEEILLSDKSKGKTEQTTTATKDRQNNSQREVKTPNQARAIDSTSGSVREGAISDSSGSADAGPRGSGTPDRIERSSRGPASTSGATPISIEKKSRSNANASVDRDQIVTFFKDYQQAKRKLRDPKFVDTLKKNSISVLDTAGNVIGDQKGSIVYLDTGTNYVRQK